MSFFSRWIGKAFAGEIRRQARALFAAENDQTFTLGASSSVAERRDRLSCDRAEVLEQALEAWRINPLARRIVGLTTQYVVGGGLSLRCRHEPTARFLDRFWSHPLNRMSLRVHEFCDELGRTGNLFLLLSTDAAGMSYLRAVPASAIERIECLPNDVEQPLAFYPKPALENPFPKPWPAYTPDLDAPQPPGMAGKGFEPVMLHYAINRPVGAQWGESDLAPLLRWLARYANWLEDRARLNRFRTAFLYVVKARFANEADRLARQQHLNAHPPTPGSILVTDEGEEWSVISPRLESEDAHSDGLALKKMIAAGAGLPLHFLAEPESATRATAEAAGGPTYRHFEQRQNYFLAIIADVLGVVVRRRALVDRHLSTTEKIVVSGADISARDNVSFGLAATYMTNILTLLRDRALIDDAELLRLVYRFAGETANVEEMLERGRQAGLRPGGVGSRPGSGRGAPLPADPEKAAKAAATFLP